MLLHWSLHGLQGSNLHHVVILAMRINFCIALLFPKLDYAVELL